MTHYENKSSGVAEVERDANSFASPKCSNVTGRKELRVGMDNSIVIYQDDDEVTRVSVRFADEDLWLTQSQLAEIYCTTQQNIAQHIANIYNDKELDEVTHKKFLLVRQEGSRNVQRNIERKIIHKTRRDKRMCATVSHTLTIRPEEKDVMVKVVVNLINKNNQ